MHRKVFYLGTTLIWSSLSKVAILVQPL